MELKATKYQVSDRVATITLSRPHRANAWTGRMHSEYRHNLSAAENDPEVRALLITGEGDYFCVGGDSEALEGHSARGSYDDGLDPTSATPGYGVHKNFDADMAFHFGLSKPIIAAINGPAAGIGLVLACFADIRICEPATKLTTAHGKLNLPAEYGLSWHLPRLIGLSRAMELLLTSRVFTGEEANTFGLVHSISEPGQCLSTAEAWAQNLIATVSARSLTESRRQVYLDQHNQIAESVADSLRLTNEMISEPDFAKGVEAMKTRSVPGF